MKLPQGKSRLDLVKEGVLSQSTLPKRGRFIVSIHKLLEDPNNERRTFRGMEGLIASVKMHGIVEPITVTAEGDGFRILTGHRRFRAAKAAGLTEVEVIARDPEDAVTRRRKSIVSNVQREDIGAVEMAEALQTLLDEDESIQTQRQLAAVIGKGEAWVSEMLGILRLPAMLQEKLRTSEVTVPYDSAMKIAHNRDVDFQKELVSAVLKGETVREIRQRIAEKKPVNLAATEKRSGAASTAATNRPSAAQVTVTESIDGYTATIRGPRGKGAREMMVSALEKLIQTLHSHPDLDSR
jgi:ParB family transcriptional regulator, chromosome partitioning protein